MLSFSHFYHHIHKSEGSCELLYWDFRSLVIRSYTHKPYMRSPTFLMIKNHNCVYDMCTEDEGEVLKIESKPHQAARELYEATLKVQRILYDAMCNM